MDTSLGTLGSGVPRELQRKFAQARVRIRTMSVLKGLALVVFITLAAFAVIVPIDYLLWFGTPLRVLVFAATVCALVVCLVLKLVLPLLRRYTARQIALSVEDRHPQLGDIVVSTVELTEMRAEGNSATSAQLVEALAQETLGRTRDVDFRSVAPFAAVRWALFLAMTFVIIVGAYCVIDMPVVQSAFSRFLYPTADIAPYTHTSIDVTTGSCTVKRGGSLDVLAVVSRRVPSRAVIVWRTEGRDGKRARVGLDKGEFRYTFKSVLRPTTYRIVAGDARSPWYTITPVDPPSIVDTDVTLDYPDYTHRKSELAVSSGDVQVLRGTRVTVTATASKPVASAWATFETMATTGGETSAELLESPTETMEIPVNGIAVGPLVFDVTVPMTYQIHLRDGHGFENTPTRHLVKPEPDTTPTIDIVLPTGTTERTIEAAVPVRFFVRDDYGLTELRIVYHAASAMPAEEKDRVASEEVDGKILLDLDPPGTAEFGADYWLDLALLELEPGMRLDFTIEATDNDTIDGPKTGRSSMRTIIIVSDESSVALIEREQRELLNRLIRLLSRQKDNLKLTETLEREQAAGRLSPEQERALEQAKREQDEIASSTRKLATDFDPTIERMQQNSLIHPQSVVQMEAMKGALGQIAQGDMPDATQQLQDAREAGTSEARAERLAQAEQTEERIVTDLERVQSQFEQLMRQQKLLELATAIGQTAKEQDRNIQNTKDARSGLMGKRLEDLSEEDRRRLKQLGEKENQLRKKVEDLEKQLEEALRDLERNRSDDAKAVDEALDDMRKSGIGDSMKQAEEDLRASQLNKSLGPQNKASEDLWRLSKRLEQAHKKKLGGEFQNTEQEMKDQISELDRLIAFEEAIIAATEALPTGEGALDGRDVIAEMIVRFGLVEDEQRRTYERAHGFSNKLADMFSQLIIFGVDPVTPMRAAVNSMGDAKEQLCQIRRDAALHDERRALEALKVARDQLGEALAKMEMDAQMQQLMDQIDRLSEIIEKQRKINEDTKATDIQRPPTEDLSAAFRRLIERLGNRQGRLGGEVTALGVMLQELLEIGQKMTDVSKMLQGMRTGGDVQEEQEKILAALEQLSLDLQKKLQQMMDAAGAGVKAGSTGSGNRSGLNLPARLTKIEPGSAAELRLPPRLQERLRQAWTEKYPESFRELLSLYYRRLSDEDNPY
ncbi:MAG: hypothetical protein JW889_04440 [Verrucomicrobia bacterium]|nr:hypothetical protein [Verrucomicrobiota bacterium]